VEKSKAMKVPRRQQASAFLIFPEEAKKIISQYPFNREGECIEPDDGNPAVPEKS